MIHQVAIKSLPQEWLWCEAWCDDASKVRAKTIDLVSHSRPLLPAAASILTVLPWTVTSKMVLRRFNPAHLSRFVVVSNGVL